MAGAADGAGGGFSCVGAGVDVAAAAGLAACVIAACSLILPRQAMPKAMAMTSPAHSNQRQNRA